MTTTRYVVGFLLDSQRNRVVLVRKNRPEWQAGCLNGVGGKIEGIETAAEAMAREFEEEAGLKTDPFDWEYLCKISWKDDIERLGSTSSPSVIFFRLIWPGDEPLEELVNTKTDEEIEIHDVRLAAAGFQKLIPNLHWLLPLAAYTADKYEFFTVWATTEEAYYAS